MRFQVLLCAGLLVLTVASASPAQVIEIKPKRTTKEPPAAAPPPRPAPRVPVAPADNPAAAAPLQTIIEVEILSPEILGDPSAQNWGKVFEDLGASVRVRNGRDVKSGVSEKVRGSLRYVTASGLLDHNSELTFGATTFKLNEPERVKEWLAELKMYGALGAPTGKPLWGLSRAQFALVNDQMTAALTVEVAGQSLPELVQKLNSDAHLPIHLAPATETWLQEDAARTQPIKVSVAGFTTGTGLAIALNGRGTGFRPKRTPAGKVEYEILPLAQLTDPWPIGWEPAEATPRNLITPGLFEIGVVGFEETALVEVLSLIQTESKTPIVIDMYRSLAKKIDVTRLTASYPAKKTAWAMVVSQCARKGGLYNYYRQDEAGRGFILIAPFESKPVKPE